MAEGEILFVEIGQYAFWITVASIIGIIITSWRAVDSARGDRKLRFAEMLENFEQIFMKLLNVNTLQKISSPVFVRQEICYIYSNV